MPTYPRTTSRAWMALTILLASITGAAAQGYQDRYQQRDQQRAIDELRSQRQQSDRRLGDDLGRRLQQQELRGRQLELENKMRREQLRQDLQRQQERR